MNPKPLGDKYLIHLNCCIGAGAFSAVYKGSVKNNKYEMVAIKVIKQHNFKTREQKEILKYLERELETQRQLDSKYIVKMLDVLQFDKKEYIVLEYCPDGNLYEYLKKNGGKLSEQEALDYFIHVVKGYKALYVKNILHRDIKPQNILLKDGIAKLADFGLARMIDDMDASMTMTLVGTPMYCSPQIFTCDRFSAKTDIWSLGCVFYELLYGQTPFSGFTPTEIYNNITTKPLKFPEIPKVQNEIKMLISKMLQIKEEDRITWDALFVHPYIKYKADDEQNQILNQSLRDSLENMQPIQQEVQNQFIAQQLQQSQNNKIIKLVDSYINYKCELGIFINYAYSQTFTYQKANNLDQHSYFCTLYAYGKYQQRVSNELINLFNNKTLVQKVNNVFNQADWDLYRTNKEFFNKLNKLKEDQRNMDKFLTSQMTKFTNYCAQSANLYPQDCQDFQILATTQDAEQFDRAYRHLSIKYVQTLKRNPQLNDNQYLTLIILLYNANRPESSFKFKQDTLETYISALQKNPIRDKYKTVQLIYQQLGE